MSLHDYILARQEKPPPELIDGYPSFNPDFYEVVYQVWTTNEQYTLQRRFEICEQVLRNVTPSERLRFIELTWEQKEKP